MPADITQRKGRTTPTVRRVRRTRYKKPIGPPAPGRKAPGPFPQSPSTSVPSPPGPVTRRRAIRRHKRSKQYKRAIKAARRSKKRAENYRRSVATLRLMDASFDQAARERRARIQKGGVGGAGDFLGIGGALEGFGKKGGGLALDILEETTRPVHGVAGLTRAAVQGKSAYEQQRAFVKGLKNEEKYLFSDVLKAAGAPKVVQSVGGFGLDVLADPTTYVTFGVGSVAKQAALKEGQRIAKKALEKGMSEQGAKTVANRAAARKLAQLHREGKATKGLTVGVGKARTSGETTAKLSRKLGVSKTAKKVRRKRSVQAAGENLRPDFRPAGAAPASFKKLRVAERRHRAVAHAGERKAQNRAVAYSKELSRSDYAKVIDALEGGKLSKLTDPRLREIARRMRDDFRYMHRLERQRGIAGSGKIKGYFPHIPGHTMEPGAKPTRKASAANLGSAKTRTIKKPLKTLRREDPSLFSEDIPLVFGTRAASSARGIAKADYLKAVAQSGRRLTPETKIDTALEAAYKVTPTGIVQKPWGEALRAVERGQRGYVVLNKAVADRALKATARPSGAVADLGRFWDRKLQGRVKTILTVPNPQYHFTNLYGDLFNAYLGDVSLKSLGQSAKVLRRLAKREAAAKTLGKQIDPTDKGVKIGGRKVGYDELIKEAEEAGAIRTGFIGRDLPDVLDAQAQEFAERLGRGRIAAKSKTAKKIATKAPAVAHPIQAIRNVSQYREDFVRLGTYLTGRKAGMSVDDAAAKVAKYHFDYGDLTEFERTVLRRVFPFYTFTARNTPLQIGTLISKPGKYANLQKVREEAAKAFNLPEGWEDKLQDYEQRGVPFPTPFKVRLGEGQEMPLLLFPKLPVMDIGRLTVNPLEQGRYLSAMVTPLIKSPIELAFDFNFFFGEPITNDQSPLVAAPDWVGQLPGTVRASIGVKRFRDKQSGKMIWGWPGKVDYVARLTPMSATAIQLGTDARNDRGQDRWMKLFSYATGLKLSTYDKTKNALNRAYERRGEIEAKQNLLRQQDRTTRKDGSYRPEYRKLLDEGNRLSARIWRLKKKAGYKILPTTGAPSGESGSSTDRIDKALGGSSDNEALDRIDRALGNTSDTDALDRIDKALGR